MLTYHVLFSCVTYYMYLCEEGVQMSFCLEIVFFLLNGSCFDFFVHASSFISITRSERSVFVKKEYKERQDEDSLWKDR